MPPRRSSRVKPASKRKDALQSFLTVRETQRRERKERAAAVVVEQAERQAEENEQRDVAKMQRRYAKHVQNVAAVASSSRRAHGKGKRMARQDDEDENENEERAGRSAKRRKKSTLHMHGRSEKASKSTSRRIQERERGNDVASKATQSSRLRTRSAQRLEPVVEIVIARRPVRSVRGSNAGSSGGSKGKQSTERRAEARRPATARQASTSKNARPTRQTRSQKSAAHVKKRTPPPPAVQSRTRSRAKGRQHNDSPERARQPERPRSPSSSRRSSANSIEREPTPPVAPVKSRPKARPRVFIADTPPPEREPPPATAPANVAPENPDAPTISKPTAAATNDITSSAPIPATSTNEQEVRNAEEAAREKARSVEQTARARELFQSSCAAVAQMDTLIAHMDQLTRVVEFGVEANALTRHDEEAEAIEQQIAFLSQHADHDAQQGNNIMLSLPRAYMRTLEGDTLDSLNALRRKAELSALVQRLSDRIRVALEMTRAEASMNASQETQHVAAAAHGVTEPEEGDEENGQEEEQQSQSDRGSQAAGPNVAQNGATAITSAIAAERAHAPQAAIDGQSTAEARAAHLQQKSNDKEPAAEVVVPQAVPTADTMTTGETQAQQTDPIRQAAPDEEQRQQLQTGKGEQPTVPPPAVEGNVAPRTANGATAKTTAAASSAIATKTEGMSSLLPKVFSQQVTKKPSEAKRGVPVRLQFTDLDKRNIIEHLAATECKWSGRLIAHELEARYGRHPWQAYQSHLRDNLHKNRNYTPLVRALQRSQGEDGRKAARARLLAAVPNAQRGISVEPPSYMRVHQYAAAQDDDGVGASANG